MTNPVEPRLAPSQTRASWIILGVFVVLTLILTWPVASFLGNRMPGTATWAFDESTFGWNIWYFKHALLDLVSSPLHTELIWYPLGIDLILYTFNFFNAIIALPLLLATNVPLASNVTVLLATILSGFGVYLLALYVLCFTFHLSRFTSSAQLSTFNLQPSTALRLAAVLAGIIYAFASNRAIYAALGHYNFATTQWLPFYALYLLKTLREPKPKNAALAGFFLAMAALTDMTFAALLAMFTLIILLVSWRELTARWAAVKGLLLAGAVAAIIWAPVLIPIAREFVTGDYGVSGWGESVKLSADVVGLVTPTDLNPLASDRRAGSDMWPAALRAVEEGKGRFGDINTVFLGSVTLALAVIGAIAARRRLAAWIWTALVFGVLALGPLLQIAGRYRFSLDNLLPDGVTLPLPFTLLHFLPFISANRAPNRNSTILMLALAVLAGYGVGVVAGENLQISKSANSR